MIGMVASVSAAADNAHLIFDDGTTLINGTDICIDIYGSNNCFSSFAAGTGDITAVNTNGNYLTGGGVTGAISLLVDETYLNSTITSIASSYGGGNSSFNQTLTDSLYADISIIGDNSSWNETYADTLYADIGATGGNSSFNQTLTDSLYYAITNPSGFYNASDFGISDYFTKTDILGFSYYNSTDFSINDYYLTSNPSNYWNDTYATFNETYADTKYALIGAGADNSSWNQTYADTLYLLVGDEANLNVNSSDHWDNYDTANTTWFENIAGVLSLKLSELTSWANTWFSGKDTDDLTEGSTNLYDNRSFNQTLTDTIYADISVTGGNASFNETYTDTLYYDISNPSTFWNDTFATFNKTYADTLYASILVTGDNSSFNETYTNTLYALIGYGDDWNKTYADGLYADIGVTGDNESWNESYANTLYYDISNPSSFWNSTFALFNKTYADTLYAGISVTGDDASWNKTYADTLYSPLNYGDDWNKTYADTLYADIGATGGNSSFNQTLTDSLYYAITNPSSFYNASDFGISDYFTKTDILGFSYYNSTDFTITDYYLTSNPSNYWNDTYATFNKTYADTLYAIIGYGDDWNKTYADGLYISTTDEANLNVNSSDYWDDMNTFNTTQMEDDGGQLHILLTWFTSTWNNIFSGKDTDDLTEGSTNLYDNQSWTETVANGLYADIGVTGDNSSWNQSLADTVYAPINYGDDWNKTYADDLYVDVAGDTMTGNLNIANQNITTSGSGVIYSNSTCAFIKGASSILEIC
jgi:CDGSH-type Zn-finger protein